MSHHTIQNSSQMNNTTTYSFPSNNTIVPIQIQSGSISFTSSNQVLTSNGPTWSVWSDHDKVTSEKEILQVENLKLQEKLKDAANFTFTFREAIANNHPQISKVPAEILGMIGEEIVKD